MIIPSFDDEIEKDKVGFGIWATLVLSLVQLSWYYSIGKFLQGRYTVKGAQLFIIQLSFFTYLPADFMHSPIRVQRNSTAIYRNCPSNVFLLIFCLLSNFDLLCKIIGNG